MIHSNILTLDDYTEHLSTKVVLTFSHSDVNNLFISPDLVSDCARNAQGYLGAACFLLPQTSLRHFAGGEVLCVYYCGSFYVNGIMISKRNLYLAFRAFSKAVEDGVFLDRPKLNEYIAMERGGSREDWPNVIPYRCRIGHVPDSLLQLSTINLHSDEIVVSGSRDKDVGLCGLFICDVLDYFNLHKKVKVVNSAVNFSFTYSGCSFESSRLDTSGDIDFDGKEGYSLSQCFCKVCSFFDKIRKKFCLPDCLLDKLASLVCGITHHGNSSYWDVSADYYHHVNSVYSLLLKGELSKDDLIEKGAPVTVIQALVGAMPGSVCLSGVVVSDKDIISCPSSVVSEKHIRLTDDSCSDSGLAPLDADYTLYIDCSFDKSKSYTSRYPKPKILYTPISFGDKIPYPGGLVYFEKLDYDGGMYYKYRRKDVKRRGVLVSPVPLATKVKVIGAIFVDRNSGNVLLSKRKRLDQYQYDFFKGRVNTLESDEVALKRELSEEMRIYGVFCFDSRIDFCEKDNPEYGGLEVAYTFFVCYTDRNFETYKTKVEWFSAVPPGSRSFIKTVFERLESNNYNPVSMTLDMGTAPTKMELTAYKKNRAGQRIQDITKK